MIHLKSKMVREIVVLCMSGGGENLQYIGTENESQNNENFPILALFLLLFCP